MLLVSVPASNVILNNSANFDSGSGSKFSLINDNLKTVTKKRKKVYEKEREKEKEEKKENEEEKEKGMKPDFENQVDSADRINLEEKKENVENFENIENVENVCHDDFFFVRGLYAILPELNKNSEIYLALGNLLSYRDDNDFSIGNNDYNNNSDYNNED